MTCVFTFITAAVIAEICSSLPLAGSIYLWAAEAGGPRFGRFFGFIVAWWSTTAWTTFCASNTQGAVNYLLSEIVVFNVDFPADSGNVRYRAVQWAVTEVMLAIACIVNLLPPKWFRWIFYASSLVILLDFLLNMIWLPIGTAQTYGFRTAHEAFMTTYNGTGAPAGWNWCLSYLATAGILIGFDASGHVAEETRNASVSAARGIFWSTVVSGVGGFIVVIMFLFCVVSIAERLLKTQGTDSSLQPDADTFFQFGSSQPFVPLYAVVLGQGGHVFMNVICIVALWFVSQSSTSPFLRSPLNFLAEYRHRRPRSLETGLCSRQRRCPSLLNLGRPSLQRTTKTCRHGCLGCLGYRDLHDPAFQHCFYKSGLGGRCAFSSSIRAHLSISARPYAKDVSQAEMEFGAT